MRNTDYPAGTRLKVVIPVAGKNRMLTVRLKMARNEYHYYGVIECLEFDEQLTQRPQPIYEENIIGTFPGKTA